MHTILLLISLCIFPDASKLESSDGGPPPITMREQCGSRKGKLPIYIKSILFVYTYSPVVDPFKTPHLSPVHGEANTAV